MQRDHLIGDARKACYRYRHEHDNENRPNDRTSLPAVTLCITAFAETPIARQIGIVDGKRGSIGTRGGRAEGE